MSAGEEPRYDAYAAWYHDWVAAPGDDLVATSLRALIGEEKGRRILDIGCGEGRIARLLAAEGNDVVGVDLSGSLLQIARGEETSRIAYVHADVSTIEWWDGEQFDGVVSSMALMDTDDLDGAISTAATTLRPGGWFVWSIIHPGFPGVDAIRPSWPDGGYFDEGWWNTGGQGVRGRVGSNHRTLSTYLNALVDHGFMLEATDEPRWSPTADDPPMPFFLVMRWRHV